MSTVRAKLLCALVCAFGLAGCSNSGIYLGTTVGAPWGGVSIGTTVPIGHGRPCCWDDDAEEDAPPAAAAPEDGTKVEAPEDDTTKDEDAEPTRRIAPATR